MSQDQFGYYKVGQFKTYSKLEAIELHGKTGQHPEWKFNELEFSLYNWKVEPSQSLEELYRNRAQQIRDKYDYLVLFFSGGSDSTNILDTFINNNIKLDECATFWAYKGDGSLDSHFSTEPSKVAVPRMQQHPDIKHRLIDLTDITNQVLEQEANWLYFMNTYFSPNNYVRSHLRRIIPEYRQMIDAGKRVCFIWGAEKPRLHVVNGKYSVRFQDLVDNTVSPFIQQFARPGEFDELFYWSPDFVDGIAKQAHTVKRYLQTGPIDGFYFTDVPRKYNYGYTVRDGKTWHLTANGINTLLYPKWDTNTLSVGKPRSTIYSDRDDWFFKTLEYTVAGKNFANGIEKLNNVLTDTLDGYWLNGTLFNGVKGCLSSPYFLE